MLTKESKKSAAEAGVNMRVEASVDQKTKPVIRTGGEDESIRTLSLVESDAARLLGVNMHTLRRWRNRGIVRPCVNLSNRRKALILYSIEELNRIREHILPIRKQGTNWIENIDGLTELGTEIK